MLDLGQQHWRPHSLIINQSNYGCYDGSSHPLWIEIVPPLRGAVTIRVKLDRFKKLLAQRAWKEFSQACGSFKRLKIKCTASLEFRQLLLHVHHVWICLDVLV